jgi:two-component system sensor histidine kinase KdpD
MRDYLWSFVWVTIGTACFWLLHPYLDKGQASLLYLPIVLLCAIRLGFGPAIAAAFLSFLCWDFFFLPPFYTIVVRDAKDWISLVVFLIAAITTAQLASKVRSESENALTREYEISRLYKASEVISQEVRSDRLLPALAEQLLKLCNASSCSIFAVEADALVRIHRQVHKEYEEGKDDSIAAVARAAFDQDLSIGIGSNRGLWEKAVDSLDLPPEASHDLGAYLPLHVEGNRVGVLYVGSRVDNARYSPLEEQLILTFSNHIAVVIAREGLANEAAKASALREADILKDSLLSLVSHELRTPLAAIKANASGLLQANSTWEESNRVEALQSINQEADRLTHLVSNLLDLSRLEAGAWKPQKDWCDIREVIATTLDRFSDADSARIEVDVADEIPLIQADYIQIALLLTNLLENAIKYSPQGTKVKLTVSRSLSALCREVTEIKIEVRDFGDGIKPSEADMLFTRFYRGARHAKSVIHGTGLGLALTKEIVNAHHGTIFASNAPAGEPKGAVFTVTLPVEQ